MSRVVFLYKKPSRQAEHYVKALIPCSNNNAMARDFQQFGMSDQQSPRSACAYAQSDQSLCLSLECSMTVKLLTEHHLDFQSLTGGCTGSSESTLSKCQIGGNHMSRLI